MGMFRSENSMEPGGAQVDGRKPRAADSPIREMTGAELAAAMQRGARKPAEPAVAEAAIKRQNHPSTDDVAKKHNLYTLDKRETRVYFADHQQKQEIMRSTPDKVSTKREDKHTVSAMLDIAKARGWETVKLKGSENYKREAWVQASMAGIKVDGYAHDATDQQELRRRQTAAAGVQAAEQRGAIGVTAIPSTKAPDAAPVAKAKAQESVAEVKAPEAKASSGKIPVQPYEAKPSVWNSLEAAGKEQRAAEPAAKVVKASQSKAA